MHHPSRSGMNARLSAHLHRPFYKFMCVLLIAALTGCGGGGGTKTSGSSSVQTSTGKEHSALSSRQSSSRSISSLETSSLGTSSIVASSSSIASASNGSSRSSVQSSNSASSNTSNKSSTSSSFLSTSSSVSSLTKSSIPSSSSSTERSSSSSSVEVIASLEIAPNIVTMKSGVSQQLVAVGKSTNGALQNMFGKVTWRLVSSSDVASINSSGLVKRLKDGDIEVEASAQGKSTRLKISSATQDITLSYDNSTTKWAKINAHIWTVAANGALTNLTGNWPGKAMTITNENNIWTYPAIPAAQFSNATLHVIFNNGAGGNGNQTDDDHSVVTESATYKDAVWTPTAANTTSAQVSVIGGGIDAGGVLFKAGTVLTVNPTTATNFTVWSGASAAYIFTDPTKATAQLVVPSGVSSMALQALFKGIDDPFKSARAKYATECSTCHGPNGTGGPGGALNNLPTSGRYTVANLASVISATMPKTAIGTCTGNAEGSCAYDIANMIMQNKWLDPSICIGDSCAVNKLALDKRRLRLLTREEYLNSVRDIFSPVSIDASVISAIPSDGTVRNFDTSSFLTLNYDRTSGYQMAAESIAKQVLSSASFFSLTSNCGSTPSCVVTALGKKIFRRPLTQVEIDRYKNLYDATDAGKAVIQSMLISPKFLYRSEVGTLDNSTNLYRLSNYETATLLSYSFWASTPDDALLAAAEAATNANSRIDIKAQVNRMLLDVKAERGLRRFAKGWLLNNKYGYSSLTSPTLPASFDEESIRFVTESIKADLPFSKMLTADYTYVNPELAKYYEMSSVASGWEKRSFADADPRKGTGILGHGSFLATRVTNIDNPSPIKRGLFVRESLLCQELPPPQKAGFVIARLPEDTNRIATARHTSDLGCASCHQFLDGIGFGLESFGSDAKYRSQEKLSNGEWKPINALGSIKSLDSAETKVDPLSKEITYGTVPELAKLIADSSQASACYSRQFYRYIVGRTELESDEAIIPAYSAKMRAGGGMREMLIELASSPSFVLRRE